MLIGVPCDCYFKGLTKPFEYTEYIRTYNNELAYIQIPEYIRIEDKELFRDIQESYFDWRYKACEHKNMLLKYIYIGIADIYEEYSIAYFGSKAEFPFLYRAMFDDVYMYEHIDIAYIPLHKIHDFIKEIDEWERRLNLKSFPFLCAIDDETKPLSLYHNYNGIASSFYCPFIHVNGSMVISAPDAMALDRNLIKNSIDDLDWIPYGYLQTSHFFIRKINDDYYKVEDIPSGKYVIVHGKNIIFDGKFNNYLEYRIVKDRHKYYKKVLELITQIRELIDFARKNKKPIIFY